MRHPSRRSRKPSPGAGDLPLRSHFLFVEARTLERMAPHGPYLFNLHKHPHSTKMCKDLELCALVFVHSHAMHPKARFSIRAAGPQHFTPKPKFILNRVRLGLETKSWNYRGVGFKAREARLSESGFGQTKRAADGGSQPSKLSP